MAVIEVVQTGLSGTDSVTSPGARKTWIAKTNSTEDGPMLVKLHSDFPRIGDPYIHQVGGTIEASDFVFCNEITAELTSKIVGGQLWTVTAVYGPPDYQSRTSPTDQIAGEEPAMTDNFTMASSVEYVQDLFFKDKDGISVRNSAGDAFTELPTIQRAIDVFTISREEWRNPNEKKRGFKDVTNADTWSGFPPGTLLMQISTNWSGKWMVSYAIKYRPEGWGLEILDAGYYKLLDASQGGQKVRISTESGPAEVPQRLDGLGGTLSASSPDVFLRFRQYESRYFSLLNLPPIE